MAAITKGPIPFLQPDEKGQFHVCQDAADILNKIRTPVAVVCVAGPYRTGKSYLLNRLIYNENAPPKEKSHHHGFNVGNTINACTKGIWLWSEPYYNKSNNTTYIFLDTEGLNSTGEEVTFDTQIFSLSVLLSSIFILNTQNSITESELEQLELVAECSKKISFQNDAQSPQKKNDNDDDDSIDYKLALHFPRLIWVLRDFALQLADKDGSPITPNQYLERTLQPIPQTGKKSVEEKNRIRKCIRDCFIKRDCLPLPRPVTDENLLHKLQDLPPTQLRPEFQNGIKQLKTRLLQLYDHFAGATAIPVAPNSVHDVTKYINNKPVTGDVLLGLALAYCEAINSGEVPTILSAWQSVVENKKLTEVDRIKREVTAFLYNFTKPTSGNDADVEFDCDVITKKYEAFFKRAHKSLLSVFPGDIESVTSVIEHVKLDANIVLKQVLETAEIMAYDYNTKLFQKILNSVEKSSNKTYKALLEHLAGVPDVIKMADDNTTPINHGTDLLHVLGDILAIFRSEAKNNKKVEKTKAIERDIIDELANIIIKAQSTSIAALAQNSIEYIKKTTTLKQKLTTAMTNLNTAEATIKAHQGEITLLTNQKAQLEQQILKDGIRLDDFKEKVANLTKNMKKMEDSNDEAYNTIKKLKTEIDQHVANHTQLTHALNSTKQTENALRHDLKNSHHDLKEAEKAINGLNTQLERTEDKLRDSTAQNDSLRRELKVINEGTATTKQQAQVELHAAEKRCTQLETALEKSNDKLEKLTEKYNQLVAEHSGLFKKVQKMDLLQEKIDKLNELYNNVIVERDELLKKHEELSKKYTTAQSSSEASSIGLKQNVSNLSEKLSQTEAKYRQKIITLKEEHSKEMADTIADFEEKLSQLEEDHQSKMIAHDQDLQAQFQVLLEEKEAYFAKEIAAANDGSGNVIYNMSMNDGFSEEEEFLNSKKRKSPSKNDVDDRKLSKKAKRLSIASSEDEQADLFGDDVHYSDNDDEVFIQPKQRLSVKKLVSNNSRWEKEFSQPSPIKMPDQAKIIARRKRNGSIFPDESTTPVKSQPKAMEIQENATLLRKDVKKAQELDHEVKKTVKKENKPVPAAKMTHERTISTEFKKAAQASWKNDDEAEYQELKKQAARAEKVPKKQPTSSVGKDTVKDPEKCTIIELKRWLTDLDIDLPPKAKKDELVRLVYSHDPHFNDD